MAILIGVGGAASDGSGRRDFAADSYSALTTELNALGRKASLVGKSIFIRTMNVPDLWIDTVESSSVAYTYVSDEQFIADMNTASIQTGHGLQIGYYRVLPLEGVKVDISGLLDLNSLRNYTEQQKNNGIANLGAAKKVSVSTTLPATLADNVEYRLGSKSSLALALPASGDYGIVVGFTASSAFTPTITGTTAGAPIPTTVSGKKYRLFFDWDGAAWVVSYITYS